MVSPRSVVGGPGGFYVMVFNTKCFLYQNFVESWVPGPLFFSFFLGNIYKKASGIRAMGRRLF